MQWILTADLAAAKSEKEPENFESALKFSQEVFSITSNMKK